MMRKSLRVISLALVVAAAFALAACDRPLEMVGLKDELDFVKSIIPDLQRKDFDAVDRKMSPDAKKAAPELRVSMQKIADSLPSEPPLSVTIGKWETRFGGSASGHHVVMEYEFPKVWILVEAWMVRKDGQLFINGMRFNASEQSATTLWLRKTASTYFIVLVMIVIGMTVYALIECLRASNLTWGWRGLWAIFILIGVGQITLNRPGDTFTVKPFWLQVPAAWVTGGGSGPVQIGLPVGAAIFIVRDIRRILARRRAKGAQTKAPPAQNA
jgi:hypothetical protein